MAYEAHTATAMRMKNQVLPINVVKLNSHNTHNPNVRGCYWTDVLFEHFDIEIK